MIGQEFRARTSNRRRYRFSLRTLLGLVTVLCVCLGLFVRQVYVQKRAVSALEEKGALVYYGKTAPWIIDFVDRDLIGAPTAISLYQTDASDADLLHLKDLPHLKILNIGATRVTDDGLAHLATLPNLERIVCERAQFTAAGIERLRKMQLDCETVAGPLEGWLFSTPDMIKQRLSADSQPAP